MVRPKDDAAHHQRQRNDAHHHLPPPGLLPLGEAEDQGF